jgi:DNA transformation protein and related proteins
MSAAIRNIGPKSSAWLRQVGVRSMEDLQRVGVLEAFLKVKRAGFRPSLNLLWSMEGALRDCHWTDVPDERRAELLRALDAAEDIAAAANARPIGDVVTRVSEGYEDELLGSDPEHPPDEN